jgi:hypothetical protein
MLMIPIFLKHKDLHPPDVASYILVAANGTFLVKNMNTFSSTCMLDASAMALLDQQEGVVLHTGSIPSVLISTVLSFFKRVFLWHGGEAIVMLYYSPRTKTFRAEAPPQRVVCYPHRDSWAATGDYLEYEACERPAGFVKFGSIHSHCDAPAFHSATDIRDEKHDDGLHITIGNILHRHPDVSASFVVNGRRFMLNPAACIEDYGNYTSCEPPPHWIARVTCMVARNGKLEAMKISNENHPGVPPVA